MKRAELERSLDEIKKVVERFRDSAVEARKMAANAADGAAWALKLLDSLKTDLNKKLAPKPKRKKKDRRK